MYRNARLKEDPYYSSTKPNTRPQGINTIGDPLYGVCMAQNQTPLHYPAMLNPYPTYQKPFPGRSVLSLLLRAHKASYRAMCEFCALTLIL